MRFSSTIMLLAWVVLNSSSAVGAGSKCDQCSMQPITDQVPVPAYQVRCSKGIIDYARQSPNRPYVECRAPRINGQRIGAIPQTFSPRLSISLCKSVFQTYGLLGRVKVTYNSDALRYFDYIYPYQRAFVFDNRKEDANGFKRATSRDVAKEVAILISDTIKCGYLPTDQ